MAKKMIDVQKLRDELSPIFKGQEDCELLHHFAGVIYAVINTQPTIELVTCKECKYRMEDNCIFQTGDGGIPDDGYCDYGKEVTDTHENCG